MGYCSDETAVYRLYDPTTKRYVNSRNVAFDEETQTKQEITHDDGVEKIDHADVDLVRTARNVRGSLKNEAAGENSEVVK